MELLESRQLLHGASFVYDQVTPLWFQAGQQRSESVEVGQMAISPSSFIGPQRTTSMDAAWRQEWLIRLSPETADQINSMVEADAMLDSEYVNFDVIRGLGLPGMLLVESFSSSEGLAALSLASNEFITAFTRNDVVHGSQLPGDPLFPNMTNLNNSGQFGSTLDADIDASEAWDLTTGSKSVVVGVIDSGIDVTHADLYLNVWLNQGEIPGGTKGQLNDLDGDGRITFWDLNNLRVVGSSIYVASTVTLDTQGTLVSGTLATVTQMTVATPFAAGLNGNLVQDLNSNGRIDAIDLLGDARWADAADSDGNGFTDDLFGWNFRGQANEPFAPNNPSDLFGHGTHVSGTIAAVGNNGVGVTGVNWQSSLMSIKFLDAQNQGTQADAIAAINYATMMRSQYGVNVRVTNHSWGQSGSENPLLRAAIEASGDAGILFVAAAGNGDALGQGSDNDRTPYYPAAYDLPNVISVAASDAHDQLAIFSNFGSQSVDLAAPGVGVNSTLPADRYGSGNGTSMAAAHVSAAAALIWSVRPTATVEEIRGAILSGADAKAALQNKVASGARLNAYNAIQSEIFTPAAVVVSANPITTAGGSTQQIVVQFHYHNGIDPSSFGDDDLRVIHRWGAGEQIDATLIPNSVTPFPDANTFRATYEITAPGGQWDPLDFGRYDIAVLTGAVSSSSGLQFVNGQQIGSFNVRIAAPDVMYVTTGLDTVDVNVGDGICVDASGACSLRAAIQEANAASPAPRTIILDIGEAHLSIPHQTDPTSAFPNLASVDGLPDIANVTGWSNDTTGDLDVLGNVTIVGNQTDLTRISGSGSDRIFKVHPGGSLSLHRVTLSGGLAPADQGGGAILSAGTVHLDLVTVKGNQSSDAGTGIGGGGIALWGGSIEIHQSTITSNSAEIGGGLLASHGATATITQSTFVDNVASTGNGLSSPDLDRIGGGGIVALKSGAINVENSTFSANTANNAAGAAIGVFSLVPRVVVASANVPTAIPDKGTVTSQLTVSGFTDVLSDVNVKLSIDHTFNGDLNVFLISPAGTRIELFTGVGAGSNNFTNTILDDESLVGIGSGSAPYTGTFRPEGRLSDLAGQNPNGIWRLEITDTTASDVGTLKSWSLDLEPQDGSSAKANLNHVTAAFQAGASTIAGRVRMRSSLLAGNIGVPIGVGVTDRGFNVVTDAPSIGPLQFLGGPTLAHPLNAGNPAIDGANSADFPAFDQLGNARPQRGGDFLTRPDVGAVEMVGGFADGSVFLDRNGDATRGVEELGLPDFTVFVDVNGNGQLDAGEPQSVTGAGEQAGRFLFSNLTAGPHRIILQAPANWTISHQATLTNLRRSTEDGNQFAPALSFDGNTVAFYSEHIPSSGPIQNKLLVLNRGTGNYYSPNFVDEFGFPPTEIPYTAFDAPSVSSDGHYVTFLDSFDHPFIPGPHDSIEVVDTRITGSISAGFSVASELTGFSPSDGMISLDGRYVAFTSDADVYLFDRQQETITKVSQALGGGAANGPSFNASISQDGRFFAFESAATNLIAVDNNTRKDVFVVDRNSQTVERVSIANNGTAANADAERSSISSDGRYVVFASAASNLVPNDANNASDIFVFDRDLRSIQRVSVAAASTSGDGASNNPAISANGRFVVFESAAKNLVSADTNGMIDVFLFDRESNTTIRVAESSHNATISGDGKFIAYVQGSETFVKSNPLASISDRTVILNAGETVTAAGFGLVPASGQIRGTLFEDLLVNATRDVADPGLESWVVYLDISANGQRDAGEPQAVTSADGSYVFPSVAGYENYIVRAEVPSGWKQVLPDVTISAGREVFVNAGQVVNLQDFGFVRVAGGVPPQNGSVSGLIFQDADKNGTRQPTESGVPNVTVFLDLNDDGLLQPEEPSATTDASGAYSFSGLGVGNFTIRALLPAGPELSTPLGNAFDKESLPARADLRTLAGVQDMLLVDLNGDTKPDLVTVLHEANLLSIRLNDGNGSFSMSSINIPLFPTATGPVALAAGDLNLKGSTDLVIVNQLVGTSTLLFDFNGTGFDSTASYAVGQLPSDVTIGNFDGLSGLDFAVANAGSDTITLMLNNGSGTFTPSILPSGGKRPTSIVAGHFNDDTRLDLAIANFGDHPSGANLGNVSVLINQGGATFAAPVSYQAGFGPAAITAADLNGDGRSDLAVAGFLSNTVSLLLGSPSGVFDTSTRSLPVGRGPIQVLAADIDTDGDQDLLVAGAFLQQASILRNEWNRGTFALAPPEQVTAANAVDERAEIAIGDVNQDGAPDIVLTGLSGETISILRNSPANGAYRVALTGVETVANLNFGILPPPVEAIILEGAGETVDMTSLDESLRTSVKTIDIRGTGDNTLILDAATIQTQTPNQTLLAIANAGDQIIFDAGWQFSRVETVEGRFQRIFVNGPATLRLIGPNSWTNPINPADVNASGDATASDALAIINALAPRIVVDSQNNLVDPNTVEPSRFKFYDVNRDGRMTASDALFVINRLGRVRASGELEEDSISR